MLREILQSIKEIIVDYVKSRLFPVTVVVLVLFSILVHQLFVLQIKEGEEHMENFVYKSKKTLTIDSVRGNIYDCNGNLLAYNELSYSVVFSNDNAQTTMAKNLKISENELKNQIVNETISILEKNGDSLTLDFPIKLDANGNFQFTVKDQQLKNFLKDVYAKTDYDSMPDEQKNATADDIMEYLNTKVFDVSDSYSKEADLKIVGVRYKLWMNRYQQYVPVTIAYDIISPRLTISCRTRFTTRSIRGISFAFKIPMMRSASRIAETSGVVTTIARFAAAIAFLNPCSMPAGQSIIM